jgi:hypothetical protein
MSAAKNNQSSQQEKIQAAAAKLLQMFESGQFPKIAQRSILMKSYGKSPCNKWSIGNIITILLAGTSDARGFRQWEQVGRKVKKGAKALHILGPCTYFKTVTDPDTGEEKKETYIKGFRPIPVFAFESTEGSELDQSEFNPPAPPPLMEVAARYGIKVTYDAFGGSALGSCRIDGSEITLRAHDADVWFHELAHAVDARLSGSKLKGGQNDDQEIVAEMTSGVLCQLYGVEGYECQAWEYIKHYNNDSPEKAIKQIYRLLGRVEAIIGDILQTANDEKTEADETKAA